MEPVGSVEVAEPGGAPVDLVEHGERVDERECDLSSALRRVEGLRQTPGQWREPIDQMHQVEGAAQHVVVLAEREDSRMRHRGTSERGDHPVFATHALIGLRDRDLRRASQHPGIRSSSNDEHGVRRSSDQRLVGQRFTDSQALCIEPRAEALRVDE